MVSRGLQISEKSPTGPTERTPNPEYLIALAIYLVGKVLFNFWWKICPLYMFGQPQMVPRDLNIGFQGFGGFDSGPYHANPVLNWDLISGGAKNYWDS